MFSIVQCPRNIPKLVDLYYIHAPLSYHIYHSWTYEIFRAKTDLSWIFTRTRTPSFWVNYNISPTWIKAIWGSFPLLPMIPVRSQGGRYNLPRSLTQPLHAIANVKSRINRCPGAQPWHWRTRDALSRPPQLPWRAWSRAPGARRHLPGRSRGRRSRNPPGRSFFHGKICKNCIFHGFTLEIVVKLVLVGNLQTLPGFERHSDFSGFLRWCLSCQMDYVGIGIIP